MAEWDEKLKFTKDSVDYEAPSESPDSCNECWHFILPNRCQHVKGPIDRDDWCMKWEYSGPRPCTSGR
jgi:hypothetical protein